MFERYSEEARKIIFFGRYEASQFGGPEIQPEHILLGILRSDRDLTHRLFPSHLTGDAIRARILQSQPAREKVSTSVDMPLSHESKRAMAYGAEEAERLGHPKIEVAHLLIGLAREESSLAARIFSEAGIGEPGVGKTAILEGLAQRFSDGTLPQFSGLRVLLADAYTLFTARLTPPTSDTLLCIEGLFDPATTHSDLLELSGLALHCIATGTPAGLRATLERAPVLAGRFEVVPVDPPDPSGAANILRGLQLRYEQFHGVSFGEGAVEMAVYASGRFLAHRELPDRALDLLDEAGALVRLRRGKTVTPEDVEHVVADRVGVPASAIRAILRQKGPRELDRVMQELAAHP